MRRWMVFFLLSIVCFRPLAAEELSSYEQEEEVALVTEEKPFVPDPCAPIYRPPCRFSVRSVVVAVVAVGVAIALILGSSNGGNS